MEDCSFEIHLNSDERFDEDPLGTNDNELTSKDDLSAEGKNLSSRNLSANDKNLSSEGLSMKEENHSSEKSLQKQDKNLSSEGVLPVLQEEISDLLESQCVVSSLQECGVMIEKCCSFNSCQDCKIRKQEMLHYLHQFYESKLLFIGDRERLVGEMRKETIESILESPYSMTLLEMFLKYPCLLRGAKDRGVPLKILATGESMIKDIFGAIQKPMSRVKVLMMQVMIFLMILNSASCIEDFRIKTYDSGILVEQNMFKNTIVLFNEKVKLDNINKCSQYIKSFKEDFKKFKIPSNDNFICFQEEQSLTDLSEFSNIQNDLELKHIEIPWWGVSNSKPVFRSFLRRNSKGELFCQYMLNDWVIAREKSESPLEFQISQNSSIDYYYFKKANLENIVTRISQYYRTQDVFNCLVPGRLSMNFVTRNFSSKSLAQCAYACKVDTNCRFYSYSLYLQECFLSHNLSMEKLDTIQQVFSFKNLEVIGNRFCQYHLLQKEILFLNNSLLRPAESCDFINFIPVKQQMDYTCPNKALMLEESVYNIEKNYNSKINSYISTKIKFQLDKRTKRNAILAPLIPVATFLTREIVKYATELGYNKISEILSSKNNKNFLLSVKNRLKLPNNPILFSNFSMLKSINLKHADKEIKDRANAFYKIKMLREICDNRLDKIYNVSNNPYPVEDETRKHLYNKSFLYSIHLKNDYVFRNYIFVEQKKLKNAASFIFLPLEPKLFETPRAWISAKNMHISEKSFRCFANLLIGKVLDNFECNQKSSKQIIENNIFLAKSTVDSSFQILVINKKVSLYISCVGMQEIFEILGTFIIIFENSCNVFIDLRQVYFAENFETDKKVEFLKIFYSNGTFINNENFGWSTEVTYILASGGTFMILMIFSIIAFCLLKKKYNNDNVSRTDNNTYRTTDHFNE